MARQFNLASAISSNNICQDPIEAKEVCTKRKSLLEVVNSLAQTETQVRRGTKKDKLRLRSFLRPHCIEHKCQCWRKRYAHHLSSQQTTRKSCSCTTFETNKRAGHRDSKYKVWRLLEPKRQRRDESDLGAMLRRVALDCEDREQLERHCKAYCERSRDKLLLAEEGCQKSAFQLGGSRDEPLPVKRRTMATYIRGDASHGGWATWETSLTSDEEAQDQDDEEAAVAGHGSNSQASDAKDYQSPQSRVLQAKERPSTQTIFAAPRRRPRTADSARHRASAQVSSGTLSKLSRAASKQERQVRAGISEYNLVHLSGGSTAPSRLSSPLRMACISSSSAPLKCRIVSLGELNKGLVHSSGQRDDYVRNHIMRPDFEQKQQKQHQRELASLKSHDTGNITAAEAQVLLHHGSALESMNRGSKRKRCSKRAARRRPKPEPVSSDESRHEETERRSELQNAQQEHLAASKVAPKETQKKRGADNYRPLVSSSSGCGGRSGGGTLSVSMATATTHLAVSSTDQDGRNVESRPASSADHLHDKARSLVKPPTPAGRTNKHQYQRRTPLTLDGLKYLIERNLVAALIGAYILVSLAVIVVLMLPYLFDLDLYESNSHHKSAKYLEDELIASLSRSIKAKQRASLGANKPMPLETKGTQTPQDWRQSFAPSSVSAKRASAMFGGAMIDRSYKEFDSRKNRAPSIESSDIQLESTTSVAIIATAAIPTTSVMNNIRTGQIQLKFNASIRNDESLAFSGERKLETDKFRKMWNVIYTSECQSIRVPFCMRTFGSMLPQTDFRGLNYNYRVYADTNVPNQFTGAKQWQLQRMLEKYQPLVDVRCFALMQMFLCSLFMPKCLPIEQNDPRLANINQLQIWHTSHNDTSPEKDPTDTKEHRRRRRQQRLVISSSAAAIDLDSENVEHQIVSSADDDNITAQVKSVDSSKRNVGYTRLVPPCRSVCREAIRRCAFFLDVLSIGLLQSSDCDALPDSDDDSVCVGQRELNILKQLMANQTCKEQTEFRCNDGTCIPKRWRCDGHFDCKDKSDEEKCSRCEMATQFYCGQDICIDKLRVCDGRVDCKDGRDERLCLRLAYASIEMNTRDGGGSGYGIGGNTVPRLRRLEVWNATHSRWMSVCGAHWQDLSLSKEACQVLGYSEAERTFISIRETNRARRNSNKKLASGSSLVEVLEQHHASSSFAPTMISEQSMDSKSIMETRYKRRSNQTIANVLQRGVQAGCEPDNPAGESSIVYLQCSEFQCGRPVTSHLSRLSTVAQQQSTQTPPPPRQSTSAQAAQQKTPVKETVKQRGPQRWDILFDNEDAVDGTNDAYREQEFEEPNWSSNNDGLILKTTTNSGRKFLDRLFEFYPNSSIGHEARGANGAIQSRLVVGGTESMPGEFPYLAALHGGPGEVFFCGGVLISFNWLLTAAHCVGERTQPDGWMVKVGVTRRIASPAFVKKLRVRKIIKHPKFNEGAHLNNDIALILLDQSVEFNQYLRPVCLPEPSLKLGPDRSKDCVVVGFGKSKFSQDASYLHVAHFVNVPIIERSVCSTWYAEQDISLTEGMICAGYSEGKRDACQGDSGSGLFCRYPETNQFFVAGVVSFGIKCATPKLPGVYTAVPLYVDWIRRVMRDHGEDEEYRRR